MVSPSFLNYFCQLYSLHGCTGVFQKHKYHYNTPCWESRGSLLSTGFSIKFSAWPTGPSMGNGALAAFAGFISAPLSHSLPALWNYVLPLPEYMPCILPQSICLHIFLHLLTVITVHAWRCQIREYLLTVLERIGRLHNFGVGAVNNVIGSGGVCSKLQNACPLSKEQLPLSNA